MAEGKQTAQEGEGEREGREVWSPCLIGVCGERGGGGEEEEGTRGRARERVRPDV